jgi:hypothetical protein
MIGIPGAAWRLSGGDILGAILGTAAAILGAKGERPETSAYSYLFTAHQRYA